MYISNWDITLQMMLDLAKINKILKILICNEKHFINRQLLHCNYFLERKL